MIRGLMQMMAGREKPGTTARRTRRFQPGLGLADVGLETRMAPAGMAFSPAAEAPPTNTTPPAPPAGDTTIVTVTNQDDSNPSPYRLTSESDSTMLIA
ncbi:MAG: hypothetical protein U0800_07835 [Isosphaeraceae bacterium]